MSRVFEHPVPRRSFLGLCLGSLLALPAARAFGQTEFRQRNYRVRICVAENVPRLIVQGRQEYIVLSDGNATVGQIRPDQPYFLDCTEGQPGAKTYRLVLRELDQHQVDQAIELARKAKETYKLPVKVFRIPSREPGGGRILVTLGEFPTLSAARARVKELANEQISLIYEDRATAVKGLVRLFDKSGRVIAQDAHRLRLSPVNPADGDLAVEKVSGGDKWSVAGLSGARRYRGDLDIVLDEEGALTAVNDVWVEHYLYSVVAAEIGGDSPIECIKAQAVAGRSEAVAKIERHIVSSSFFDFYDTAIAQAYPGRRSETALGRQAVDATRGEILVWNGNAVDAVYGHSCGGMIASSDDVWGGSGEGYSVRRLDRLVPGKTPDLSSFAAANDFVSTDEPSLCNPDQPGFPKYAKKYYRWEKRFNGREYSDLADDRFGTGRIKDVQVEARTPGGRVTKLRLTGTDKSLTIDHELTIRKALGDIYSDFFTLARDHDGDGMLSALVVRGAGFGHGVGLCQMGALMMATKGYNYRQILAHYYNEVKIRRLSY